ncbi:hypothetical protein EJ07DRAFT_166328 [Lizonia empirigonia]|nr:hypothetical protein EJ07DRAFT_166328 [Lizonia empirigonia]
MDDEVRISKDQFRYTYATGFRTWARLHSRAIKNYKLPAYCFFTPDTFPMQPAFPRNLELREYSDQITASGSSIWGSSPAKCTRYIPSSRRLVQLDVAVKDPVLLSISESAQTKCYSDLWFSSHSDYLTILMLAWAYILSARWAEVMPAGCSLIYTDNLARHYNATTNLRGSQHSLVLDIGPVKRNEARWWAAILAQGQGWQATTRPSFVSPWSIRVESSSEFLLSLETDASPLQGSASTFSEACGFLNKFCTRHNIVDQSHAALAAVLLFPYMAGETLQMPSPCFNEQNQARKGPLDHHEGFSQLHRIYDGQHLDKLLTLSCNIRGIRPLLLSVFYEPSVECNAVTPWLQGTLAAVESLAENDPSILGRMCMERTPEVACIWLGSAILGLQKKLVQDVKYGQIPLDLHSAVWSGTVQSFIQQPVSRPLVVNGYVQRADECRLLFLCQSDNHTRVPVCQWKPFGETPKDDVDLEVRIHEHCEGHELEYQGFAWNCTEGDLISHSSQHYVRQRLSQSGTQELQCAFPVVWKALDFEKEVISENATRSIISWLRSDGCAPHEKDMFKHEWFTMSDSDEDEESEEDSEEVTSTKSFQHRPQVEEWLSNASSITRPRLNFTLEA